MEAESRWLFTKEQITNTPSRKCKVDADTELQVRQHTAMYIQDLARGLRKPRLSQRSVNTAIIYMHRFYMFHSVTKFCKYQIGIASLFLASKTEDLPIKAECILIQAYRLFYKNTVVDMNSEKYLKMADDLFFYENTLLMTLGFNLTVKHAHAEVVNGCTMIQASNELSSACYLMASNSLHLTMMCLQYSPKVIACFCIHMASKWSNYHIPLSTDGRPWYTYIDGSVTEEFLNKLIEEFLCIFDKCSSKLKNAAKKCQINSESRQKKQDAVLHHDHNNNDIRPSHHSQYRRQVTAVTQSMPQMPRPEIDQRPMQQKSIFPSPPSSQKSNSSPEEGYPRNSPKGSQDDHRSQHGHSTQCRRPEIADTLLIPQMPQLESNQRPTQQKIAFPTPTFSQKSIFISEESYPRHSPKESENWNKSKPMILTPSQMPVSVSVVSPNRVIPVAGPPGMHQNLLKRRASNDGNSSQKRHCISPDFKRSTKLTEEISSILKTAIISTEPSMSLPSANFSSDRSLADKAFRVLPIDILDNGVEKQDILVLKDKSQTVNVESSMVEVESLPSTLDFSQILSVPLEESNLTRKKNKKSKHKSKKSKKDKKKKKEKKKGKEKRKEKLSQESKDNEKKNSDEQVPSMSIKIRIPKERLNLSNDFLHASKTISESPQNGSLRIKISKNRLSYCDTYSTTPV